MNSRNERQNYTVILTIVFVIHTGLLFLTYSLHRDVKTTIAKSSESGKAMKVIQLKDYKRILPKNMKQMVASEDPESFKKPKNSKYFSDKNRSFERESVSRNNGSFKKAIRGSAASTAGGGGKGGLRGGKKSYSLSDLGQPADRHPLMAAAKQYAARGNKHAPGALRAPTSANAQASATNDFVEGVPLGDLTHLNTQEHKFYGFYHRIKLKLEQFWGRSIHETAERLHKSGRRIASDSNVITALRVTLDHMGEIIAISVVGPSGVKELDDAAIESFNEAGPFPNPPKDMVVDGKVTLEWGFVVRS